MTGLIFAALLHLTPAEDGLVKDRIHRFYNPREGVADPMFEPIPKFDAESGQRVHPNPQLRLPDPNVENPLLRLAQFKATDAFQRWYCEQVLKKRFPGMECDLACSAAGSNDRIENLTDSWIPAKDLVRDLSGVPVTGQTSLGMWSDDYWRTQWGETSYRYLEKKAFTQYKVAIADYKQPLTWILLGANPLGPLMTERITTWSPSEKYDLTVGDDKFSLTTKQKNRGLEALGRDGNVEPWAGICHGWAPAAIMLQKPVKKVMWKTKRGFDVTWYPHDIRALASLSWSITTTKNNYAGSRCYVKNPTAFPNGRISDDSCFDTNPATFHLALGNLIGVKKLSFIMDKTFDYEIWNQPLHSYTFVYFDPTRPERKSGNWREVAVDYDDKFKKMDRFQRPLTRGVDRGNGKRDDSAIRKIVGVQASVVYLAEVLPRDTEASEEAFTRVTYLYDLELETYGSGFQPTGGEWHSNAHPDFLWIPRKGEVALTMQETNEKLFTFPEISPRLKQLAVSASEEGFPLCSVVSELVARSAEKSLYKCVPPKP